MTGIEFQCRVAWKRADLEHWPVDPWRRHLGSGNLLAALEKNAERERRMDFLRAVCPDPFPALTFRPEEWRMPAGTRLEVDVPLEERGFGV